MDWGAMIGLPALWAAGAALKHKTRADHKVLGVPVNLILGQACAQVAAGGEFSLAAIGTGLLVSAASELGLAGSKSTRRLGQHINGSVK